MLISIRHRTVLRWKLLHLLTHCAAQEPGSCLHDLEQAQHPSQKDCVPLQLQGSYHKHTHPPPFSEIYPNAMFPIIYLYKYFILCIAIEITKC